MNGGFGHRHGGGITFVVGGEFRLGGSGFVCRGVAGGFQTLAESFFAHANFFAGGFELFTSFLVQLAARLAKLRQRTLGRFDAGINVSKDLLA